MKRAVVLGAGMIGSTMARDLASNDGFEVTIADVRTEALHAAAGRNARIKTKRVDLVDPTAVAKLVEGFDVVLGALSSRIGFAVMSAMIEAGRPYCDISFFSQEALDLDETARKRGVTVVTDCGVAPGMSNMLVGFAASKLATLTKVRVYVGGVPAERRWPFEYKAAFSPADVIEEYTRPARLVVDGKVVAREALSEAELLDFDGVGTLEAFNTDGLRSLIRTIKCPDMAEKTMRYPGHCELMRVFRHLGLFSNESMAVGAERAPVRPIDLTSALLFPAWTYKDSEEDLTVMRVIVEGEEAGSRSGGGVRRRYTWDLLDRRDRATGETSMARTTAFPATIVARMMATGEFVGPGVNPPEILGRQAGVLDKVLLELKAKGVEYKAKSEVITS